MSPEIERIQNYKAKLERDIASLLLTFHNDTGCMADALDIVSRIRSDTTGVRYIDSTTVSVDVRVL